MRWYKDVLFKWRQQMYRGKGKDKKSSTHTIDISMEDVNGFLEEIDSYLDDVVSNFSANIGNHERHKKKHHHKKREM